MVSFALVKSRVFKSCLAILSTSSETHHDELPWHSSETQRVSLDFGKRLEVAHRKDTWAPPMPPCKTWRS